MLAEGTRAEDALGDRDGVRHELSKEGEGFPLEREFKSLIVGLPKAELHLHIEGTLEPELMLELAQRNGISLRYKSLEEARNACQQFSDLRSFLDVYYEAQRVLLTERDFYDLTWSYLRRVAPQNVRHVEIFFDPQTHTSRGVAFGVVVGGIRKALLKADQTLGITSRLILCFLRHLDEQSAMKTLEQALQYKDWITAVGIDSCEAGNPPEKFARVFERARAEGFLAVAHAGEEGPPEYLRQALDILKARRLEHGVRCLEDEELVGRLAADRVPLTVCPLSNVKLGVVRRLEDHPLKRMLDAGLCVSVNSDDPAYFGGYVEENFVAVRHALNLSSDDVIALARNSFEASFLTNEEKNKYYNTIEQLRVKMDTELASSSGRACECESMGTGHEGDTSVQQRPSVTCDLSE
jgi:adenosine deaminase